MYMISKTSKCLPVIGLLIAQSLSADEQLHWRAEAQLGILDSKGEKHDRTMNGRLRLQSENDLWRNDTRAQFLQTRTDGELTKENYSLSHQVDYRWTERFYSLAFARYERNPFATFGKEYDLLGGVGYRVIKEAATEWDLEAGLGTKITERSAPPQEKENSLLRRAASKVSHDLTENLRLRQEIIYDETRDANEWRLLHSFAVRANEFFSLSISHEWKRVDDTVTNVQEVDRITTLNLVFDWDGRR
ncbi:DUF481 domain-containing protein [Marinospirillum alkaliphilum]|uniref:Putative salt-induced outer membrane protein YdiY n=1 Tax=Marinospirillum alkaliphilum DSM 21637 TaxID=1122209 RepID=A0A1K1Z8K2_9GAMM|nr:DUF481 domain-containing protein [Marinospirillum alkaliphilum]SFX69853.1 Putative salt-induced outer membrane protein YdiY [Marinospirillum alkaliphilum DSM 21637]